MNKKLISVVATAFILAGCASGVTRAPNASAQRPSAPAYSQFASVSLSLTNEAREKAVENLKFNPDELLSHVRRALEVRSLLNGSAGKPLPRLEVVGRSWAQSPIVRNGAWRVTDPGAGRRNLL